MKKSSASPLLRVVAISLVVASPIGLWWLAKPQTATGLTREQLKNYGVDPTRFCPDESDYYDFRKSHSTWIFRGKCRPDVANAWLERLRRQESLQPSFHGTPYPGPILKSDEVAPTYTIVYDNDFNRSRPMLGRVIWIGYNETTGDWYYMQSDL